MTTDSGRKWRHIQPDMIRLNVRWYCRYALSDRDWPEMMPARGVEVDHAPINRWAWQYAPDKRIWAVLPPPHDAWRVAETDSDITGVSPE
jgi:transposase, IS6 family